MAASTTTLTTTAFPLAPSHLLPPPIRTSARGGGGGSSRFAHPGMRGSVRDVMPLPLAAEELFERMEVERGSPMHATQGESRAYWPHGEPTSVEVYCLLGLMEGVAVQQEAVQQDGEGPGRGERDAAKAAAGRSGAGAMDVDGAAKVLAAVAAETKEGRRGGWKLPLKRGMAGAAAAAAGAAASSAASQQGGGEEERGVGDAPLSPLSNPETYSPVRDDWGDSGAGAPHSRGTGPLGGLDGPPLGTTSAAAAAAAARGGRVAAAAAAGSSLPLPPPPHAGGGGGMVRPPPLHAHPIVMGLHEAAAASQQQRVGGAGGPAGLGLGGPPPLARRSPSSADAAAAAVGGIGAGAFPGSGGAGSSEPVVLSLQSLRSSTSDRPSSGFGAGSHHAGSNGTGLANGHHAHGVVMPRLTSLSEWVKPLANGGGQLPGSAGGTPTHGPLVAAAAAAAGDDAASADSPAWEGWTRLPSANHPDTWDAPNESFEAFVSETVTHRIGKYVQPDHPNRITNKDAHALNKKIVREVIDKEKRAHAERMEAAAGAGGGGAVAHRPIERRKLEGNIKEFVRLSIRRFHTQH